MEERSIATSLPFTGDREWQATREPFSTGWVTQNPKGVEFEKNFAERRGVSALTTTSCTTELYLVLTTMGVLRKNRMTREDFEFVANAPRAIS